jgi:hypothetical protein
MVEAYRGNLLFASCCLVRTDEAEGIACINAICLIDGARDLNIEGASYATLVANCSHSLQIIRVDAAVMNQVQEC